MKTTGISSGIVNPSSNDVLFGKGHNIHNHSGNQQYRRIVDDKKRIYAMATKTVDKRTIANQVLQTIRRLNPPGRFLKKDQDGKYYEQDDNMVVTKIKQALRENLPARRDRIQVDAAAAATSRKKGHKSNPDQHEGFLPIRNSGSDQLSQMSKNRTNRSNHRSNVPTKKDVNHLLNLLMVDEKGKGK